MAASFACLLAACGGAPEENAPDYEVDITSSGKRAGSSSSGGTSAGDESGSSSGGSGATQTSSGTAESSTSSSGTSGTSSSGGSTSSSSGSTTPAPTTVTLTIDGASYTIGTTNLWSEVSKAGEYDIFIPLTGPGAPSGSDFHVSATHTGTGCDNTKNFLTYRPSGDAQYMPTPTTIAPSCGLTIESLPTAVGGRFKGSFKGTLTSINVTPSKSKQFDLKFDVLRAK